MDESRDRMWKTGARERSLSRSLARSRTEEAAAKSSNGRFPFWAAASVASAAVAVCVNTSVG